VPRTAPAPAASNTKPASTETKPSGASTTATADAGRGADALGETAKTASPAEQRMAKLKSELAKATTDDGRQAAFDEVAAGADEAERAKLFNHMLTTVSPERRQKIHAFLGTIDINQKLEAASDDAARRQIMQRELEASAKDPDRQKVIIEQTRFRLTESGRADLDSAFASLGAAKAFTDKRDHMVRELRAAPDLPAKVAIAERFRGSEGEQARKDELFGTFLAELPAAEREQVVQFLRQVEWNAAVEQARADQERRFYEGVAASQREAAQRARQQRSNGGGGGGGSEPAPSPTTTPAPATPASPRTPRSVPSLGAYHSANVPRLTWPPSPLLLPLGDLTRPQSNLPPFIGAR
jgi:hypothetical protein